MKSEENKLQQRQLTVDEFKYTAVLVISAKCEQNPVKPNLPGQSQNSTIANQHQKVEQRSCTLAK